MPVARTKLLGAALLLTALALLAARPLAPKSPALAQSERVRHTQNVYLISALHATDSAGNVIDLTPELQQAVAAQLDPPIALSATLSYQKSEAVGARLIDPQGGAIAAVAVQVGEITVANSDGSTASMVAALATPDVSESTAGIGPHDRVALDLSGLADAAAGQSESVSYAFMQLPPAALAESSSLSDEAVAAQRYAAGGGQLLSKDTGNGVREAVVTPGLPLQVQPGPALSAAYLAANGRLRQQSVPALEGVFGALDALSLDPDQLVPIAPDTADSAIPGASIVRGVAQNATLIDGAQGLANATVCAAGQTDGCTPAPQPAAPAPAPSADCVLSNGCVFDGTGTITWLRGGAYDDSEDDYALTFTITVPPTPAGGAATATASGSYTEKLISQTCQYDPEGRPMSMAALLQADGTLQITLADDLNQLGTQGPYTCPGPNNTGTRIAYLPQHVGPYTLPAHDGATLTTAIPHPHGDLAEYDSETATITLTLRYAGAPASAATGDCVQSIGCVFAGTGSVTWPLPAGHLPGDASTAYEDAADFDLTLVVPPTPSGQPADVSATGTFSAVLSYTNGFSSTTPDEPLGVTARLQSDGSLAIDIPGASVPGGASAGYDGPGGLPSGTPDLAVFPALQTIALPAYDGATVQSTSLVSGSVPFATTGMPTLFFALHYKGATP